MKQERQPQCALYLRLSKEDERRAESASIENQRKILRDYAEKNGFVIKREYSDDGFSGTSLNRPAFQQMLADAERGEFQIILTKDLSRLGRNSGRVNLLLDEYFPEHQIRYISVGEGIDTAQRDAASSIVAPMQNLVNELYAGDLSRKIRAAFDAKMREGACISAFAPYGYRKDPQDKNHLLVDESAGAVVRRIFSLAQEGHSPAQIAAMLNRQGVETPSQYRYRCNPQLSAEHFRGATEWKTASISKMLRNEVYLGHMLQSKSEKLGFKSRASRIKPREEWIVVPHTHEALVDERVWGIVRRRMQSRTQRREKGFVNLFSGLAVCADCGRNMSTVGTRRKGARANLNCGGYKQGGRKKCSSHTIDYDALYQAALAALRAQLDLSEGQRQWLLRELAERSGMREDQRQRQAEGRLAKLERKLEQLFDDKYEGRIAPEQFEWLLARYTAEKAALEEKSGQMQATREEEMAERGRREERIRGLIGAYADLRELHTELLFQLIERIEVHQGEYAEGERRQRIDIWFAFSCGEGEMEVRI